MLNILNYLNLQLILHTIHPPSFPLHLTQVQRAFTLDPANSTPKGSVAPPLLY